MLFEDQTSQARKFKSIIETMQYNVSPTSNHHEKTDNNDDDDSDGNDGNQVNADMHVSVEQLRESKNNAEDENNDLAEKRNKMVKNVHHRGNDEDNDDNDDGEYSHNITELTYGVTIVHCKEQRMDWMKDIPKDWKLTVYETCRQNISHASRSFKNAGSEECTAYLSNIIDNYNNLPDVNIFLQSDAFLGHGKKKKGYYTEHTPFWTFTELVNATAAWAKGPHGRGYLAYGPDNFFMNNINAHNGYLVYYPREYFDLLGLSYSKTSNTRVEGRSGACFAVHKDSIRKIPIETYELLKQSVLKENHDLSRRRCCSLENIWHVIFGEPYKIPTNSTVQHLWDTLIKQNKDLWPRKAEEADQ